MTAFVTAIQYHAFLAAWKALARAKTLSAEDMLLHALLCHGDTRGFTPVTSQIKLANGAASSGALVRAATTLWSRLYPIANEKPSPGVHSLLASARITARQARQLQAALREIQRGTFEPVAPSLEGVEHA